jgi:hypothetical protein
MVLETIKKEIKRLEGHDFLVLIGVLILILMTIRLTQSITVYEARSFFRESLINIAILLLVADLIIHVGRLEEKILKEEEEILAEEKKIIREERLIEREMRRLGLKRKKTKRKTTRKKTRRKTTRKKRKKKRKR